MAALRNELADADADAAQYRARRVTGQLAALIQGALLVRYAPAPVADAWCATRLDGGHALFGTLPAGLDVDAIVARATPRTG